MIYLEKQDYYATLTTWLYCAFWQIWSAEKEGKNVYINWEKGKCLIDLSDDEKFKEIPNMYDWYFIQHKYNKYVVEQKNNVIETWIWEKWEDKQPISLMSQPLSVIKQFYKRNLHFNEYVNKRGQEIVDKYQIDFSKTIGITWRGTDNVTDGRVTMPIEKYYKYIDMALEQIPDARIMCTAEETEVLQPLLNKYPQAFNIDEFYSSPKGSLQNPERHIPLSGFERGLQPVLMVWLFSKCAWYIKNRSSTGAVASWLSDGQIVCLGHAETLNYDKMDNEVEINGKRYEL